MLEEFKKFALRGNVVDMAVGIIIGGAFGTIVKSMVDDVLMPPIGMLLGNVDFSDLFVTLKPAAEGAHYATLAAAKAAGAVTLNVGLFINSVISFVIMAFALFMLIKAMNKLQESGKAEEAPAAAPTTKECGFCCSAIPLKAIRCPCCTSELTSSV
ncbi:mechanosensitive ion channel protein MscL [Pokkaliibacter plantistimulans]|uniref:Large-conductance mechanosensitive channel n=1 Tax=Pokkaliibacter plantistimulans TaxID=1635171 RepID=A0ABX5LTT8_9GAMM|nr:large-conductance mechanosensitive channel protein MscL [Pokkaliibacter plantistimulans]PXF29015.1 mechanosensitive ion channel protein MscL [Pokkaliibacter plantistimulans]